LVLLVTIRATGEDKRFILAERDKPAVCVVVVPRLDRPSYAYAAEELTNYVKRITGTSLAVVRAPCGGTVREVVLDASDAQGEDGYRLRVEGNTLRIAGGRRGILYGVYALLEEYGGCDWFASWHEVVPEADALSVPASLDVTEKPAFEMRFTNWRDVSQHPDFAARLH